MFLLSPLKSKYGSIVKTLSVPLELSAQVELPRLSEAWLRPEAKPGLVCIHHPWPELLSGPKGSCERARGPLVRSHQVPWASDRAQRPPVLVDLLIHVARRRAIWPIARCRETSRDLA